LVTRRTRASFLILFLFTFVWPAVASASDATCSEAYESGQRLRKKGALRAASRELVICTREGCPPGLASDCLRWLDEVDAAIPSIVVAVVDGQGRDVIDARVRIDGADIDTSGGRAFDLDPGRHRIRVVSADHPTLEQDVLIREGEKRRTIRLTLDAPAAPAHAVEPPRTSRRTLPWVLFGVGAASFLTSGALGLYGLSQRSDLDACRPDCERDRVDAANRTFLVSDVILAAGALVTGLGVYFFFDRTSGGPTPTSSRGGWGRGPSGPTTTASSRPP
jgi:hypothetical protein